MNHMRKTSNQAGFTANTVIIGIVVILVAALVTLIFTSRGSGDPDAGKTTNSERGYIQFPKWGIRAPYQGSLTLSQTTDGNTARFSSKELTATDKACKGQGGTIRRWKADEDMSLSGIDGVFAAKLPRGHGLFNFSINDTGRPDVDFNGTNNAFAFVDDYYYVYYPDQGACGASNTASADVHAQTNEAVRALTKDIEAKN
jgi:hypothetical protein